MAAPQPPTPAPATASTTTTVTSDSSKLSDAEGAARVFEIDNLRARCYGAGVAQVFFGVLGIVMGFGWISSILTLAAGAVSVTTW